MNRVDQRDELLYMLGLAISPIKDAIAKGILLPQEIALLTARFGRDSSEFVEAARKYCTIDGLVLSAELNWIVGEFNKIPHCLGPMEHAEISAEGAPCLTRQMRSVRERIARVPIDLAVGVLSASPTQSYLRLRTLVSAAVNRVEIFDPYLDDEVFHRYVSAVATDVSIALVTTKDTLAHPQRGQRIVAVSTLVASERPTSYELVGAPPFHDRYMRIDGTILHLGGSLKDAGKKTPYSIGSIDASSSESLDQLIGAGDRWFAPGLVHKFK